MSRLWMVALSGAFLAACSQQQALRVETYDRIKQEMDAAVASKPTAQAQQDALSRAMVPPLQIDAPVPPKAEPRFNLAVNNAPVSQVLTALVSGTAYSMIFPPDLSGSVSVNLKNTTVREALDTLRDVYGYDYRIQGNRIIVQSNTLQTRIFRINYLANRRLGSSDMRVTGSSPTSYGGTTSGGSASTGQTAGSSGSGNASQGQQASQSSTIRTTSDYDFWKDLGGALNTIVGNQDGRNVIVNPASGVVLVKAMPSELRSVDEYLKATQLVVERQVMLEAKIIEVSLNDSYQTGINWSKFGGVTNRFTLGMLAPSATLSGSGTLAANAAGISGGTAVAAVPGTGGSMATGSAGSGFFGLTFQNKDFAALLSFLEGQGDVQVLSSPRIATTNNQKAVLKVGTDDYFVTGISGGTTTNSSSSGGSATETDPTITLLPFFSGIALDVTPQIDDDGNIILHVHPSVSDVQEKVKNFTIGGKEYSMPLASSSINESDSIVRVQDGSIVAIGGLMSQRQSTSRNGLPGVSGVTGLGALFGQKESSNVKRELVILMRSTVISGENSWRENLSESQQRMLDLDPRQRIKP